MSFRLGEGRIAVVAEEVEEKTASGIFVPGGEAVIQYGTVTHVGPRRNQDGYEVEPDVEPGERVFFHRHAGTPVEIDGTEYKFLGHNEVWGVLDPEDEEAD